MWLLLLTFFNTFREAFPRERQLIEEDKEDKREMKDAPRQAEGAGRY